MITGKANPNVTTPLEKMTITNLDTREYFEVLYNPASYVQTRQVEYSQVPLMNSDAPIVQFDSGGAESLTFDLFFDTMSSGMDVGGDWDERKEITDNGLRSSVSNKVDVRNYTSKVYNLMYVDADEHRPPELGITWSSLQFKGFLQSCTQTFTKFSEDGTPVRAILKCTFIESRDLSELFGKKSLQSPDTTKYRTVRQGDSLWAMSANEYGEASQWRQIAAANGIDNPRLLRTGDTLVVPALPD